MLNFNNSLKFQQNMRLRLFNDLWTATISIELNND